MSHALLWHLDGKLPNLALMRIAAHHRERGDHVELRRVSDGAALKARAYREIEPRFDDPAWGRVYASAIFERTRPLVDRFAHLYPDAVIGGTGSWSLRTLADVGIAEDGTLDYSSYPEFTASMGFTMRGCRFKCAHCVVPRKEGRARAHGTIADIYRGAPWPPHLHLLDNDFFGGPDWRERIAEIREGGFRMSFTQGINVRVASDEVAAAIASVDYRADDMRERRLYTAWDSLGDERVVFRGLDRLVAHGVKPDHIMVYILVGYAPGETHTQRDHRRRRLREFGARPYPMPFVRTPELVGFQLDRRRVRQEHPVGALEGGALRPAQARRSLLAAARPGDRLMAPSMTTKLRPESVAAMRARARTVPIPVALAALINRGSFHGSWLTLRAGGVDNVAYAERALKRVAATGWITRGDYEPTPVQFSTAASCRLEKLDEQHRSLLTYHWITATTRWLEPADVAAVIDRAPQPAQQAAGTPESTERSGVYDAVIALSRRASARAGAGDHAGCIELMRERDELSRQFTLAEVYAYHAWMTRRWKKKKR